jgi:hypothetical protein
MGWGSAGRYFEIVADTLVEAEASDEIKYAVCLDLIESLLADDWDTWDESVEKYRDQPSILDAFRDNNCKLQCRSYKYFEDNSVSTCDEELGHAGEHLDGWSDKTWN